MRLKKIILISSCDALANLACSDLFEENGFYYVAGVIQTKITFPDKLWLLRRAVSQGGLFYALYMQAEHFGAKIINFRLSKELSGIIENVKCRNLPIIKSFNVNSEECIKFAVELDVDVVLSVRPVQIFRKEFIQSVGKIVNIHCSKLPSYGGIGAILQALANRERFLGCSAHEVPDESIDSGNVVCQSLLKVESGKSVFYHTVKLWLLARNVISDALRLCAQDNIERKEQVKGSYYSWPNKDALHRLHREGRQMINLRDMIRAYDYFINF